MPGCVDYAKLVRISMKLGMGESARFLRPDSNWMSRLITRQFKPGRLLSDLTMWLLGRSVGGAKRCNVCARAPEPPRNW